MLRMKIAALAGLFAALPIILWQVWRFVAPGLYAHEKKFAIPFVIFSTFFFSLGAAFSHYLVFPWAIAFFATFQRPDMEFLPRVDPVFSLYVRMMLAMGLVFEMPTLAFFLARIGLITPRTLIRNIKYAVLVIFIVAAVTYTRGRCCLPGDDGRPYARSLRFEHRNCLGFPEAKLKHARGKQCLGPVNSVAGLKVALTLTDTLPRITVCELQSGHIRGNPYETNVRRAFRDRLRATPVGDGGPRTDGRPSAAGTGDDLGSVQRDAPSYDHLPWRHGIVVRPDRRNPSGKTMVLQLLPDQLGP